jgi:hypothetical protein
MQETSYSAFKMKPIDFNGLHDVIFQKMELFAYYRLMFWGEPTQSLRVQFSCKPSWLVRLFGRCPARISSGTSAIMSKSFSWVSSVLRSKFPGRISVCRDSFSLNPPQFINHSPTGRHSFSATHRLVIQPTKENLLKAVRYQKIGICYKVISNAYLQMALSHS